MQARTQITQMSIITKPWLHPDIVLRIIIAIAGTTPGVGIEMALVNRRFLVYIIKNLSHSLSLTLCQVHVIAVGLSRVSGDLKVVTGSHLMNQLL